MGGHNDRDLSAALEQDLPAPGFGLEVYLEQLPQAGFEIVDARDEMPAHLFSDVGAIVYHLNAIPWQLPGFSAARYRDALLRIHERIAAVGPFVAHAHRILLEARRP